jgi:hypothetical protein
MSAIPAFTGDRCAPVRGLVLDGHAASHSVRFSHGFASRGATIALMGRFKPARGGKKKGSTAPPGGVACVVVLLAGMFLVMLFIYWVLKSANG